MARRLISSPSPLLLCATILMIYDIKEVGASTFMSEMKDNLNRKGTKPSDDSWQQRRELNVTSEEWKTKAVKGRGSQEVGEPWHYINRPVTTQSLLFLNERHSISRRMNKRQTIRERSYHERCDGEGQCDTNLYCDPAYICMCRPGRYWSKMNYTCYLKKGFNDSCQTTDQCMGILLCSDQRCLCDGYRHWDEIKSTCEFSDFHHVLRYEGESVSLTCPERKNSVEKTKMTWHRENGDLLGDGSKLSLWYLRINHSGEYFCKAEGKIVKTFAVLVHTRDQAFSTNVTSQSFVFAIKDGPQRFTKNDERVMVPYFEEFVKRTLSDTHYVFNVERVFFQHGPPVSGQRFGNIRRCSYALGLNERYVEETEIGRIKDMMTHYHKQPLIVPPLPFNSAVRTAGFVYYKHKKVMDGEALKMKFSFFVFYDHVKPKYRLKWQFGNQFLNENSNQTGAFSTDLFESETRSPIMNVTLLYIEVKLDINNLTPALAGEYRCHLLVDLPSGQEIATVFRSIPVIFPRPRVIISPLTATVAYNSVVHYRCEFTNVWGITVIVNGETVSAMEGSVDGSMHMNGSLTTRSYQDIVICRASIMEGTILQKKLIIRSLPKDDTTPICKASYDRRGTFWPATPITLSNTFLCPDKYDGNVTRMCSGNATWLRSDYSACKRKDLVEFEDKVQVLKLLEKPSPEQVESITSDLTKSITSPVPVRGSDINQVVNILSELGSVVSEKEMGDETEALLGDSTLVNVANLTDKLMTANQNEWIEANMDNMAREPESPKKVKATDVPAGRLMLALEQLVSSTLNHSKMTSQTIVKQNFVIKRAKVSSSQDVRFPITDEKAYQEYDGWVMQSQTKAFLSHEVFPQTEDGVRYAVLLYSGIDDKLQTPNEKTYVQSACRPSPNLLGKQVKSDALSLSLNARTDVLSPRLKLSFLVPENANGPVCGFLDTAAGAWSDDGCETVILEDHLVECHCDHLTNFAVLMSPAGTDIYSQHHKILSIITIIGCSISIVCLAITVLVYALVWRYTKNDLCVIHLNLSVCLIVSYIVFMAGINEICRETLCTVTAAILHYLLLVVFFLMLSEGIEITLSVSVIFSRKSSLWKLLLVSYGVPAVLVAISLAATHVQGYRSEHYCWLSSETGTLWAFVCPALLIIVVNVVLAVLVLKVMTNTASMRNKEEAEKAKAMAKAVLALTSVLGFGWMFGILAFNDETIIFQYLFALFNSLQGLLIFIFHCLLSRQVRNGISALYRRVVSRTRSEDFSRTKAGSGVPPSEHRQDMKELTEKED